MKINTTHKIVTVTAKALYSNVSAYLSDLVSELHRITTLTNDPTWRQSYHMVAADISTLTHCSSDLTKLLINHPYECGLPEQAVEDGGWQVIVTTPTSPVTINTDDCIV